MIKVVTIRDINGKPGSVSRIEKGNMRAIGNYVTRNAMVDIESRIEMYKSNLGSDDIEAEEEVLDYYSSEECDSDIKAYLEDVEVAIREALYQMAREVVKSRVAARDKSKDKDKVPQHIKDIFDDYIRFVNMGTWTMNQWMGATTKESETFAYLVEKFTIGCDKCKGVGEIYEMCEMHKCKECDGMGYTYSTLYDECLDHQCNMGYLDGVLGKEIERLGIRHVEAR